MTTLKMILSVLGPLVFLGVFSEGFNTAYHQEITIKSDTSKSHNLAIKPVNQTHLTSHIVQSEKQG